MRVLFLQLPCFPFVLEVKHALLHLMPDPVLLWLSSKGDTEKESVVSERIKKVTGAR